MSTLFAPDDVPALLAEADRFGQERPARTLRVGLVADLAGALRRVIAERDEARRKHDRLASRIRGARAVLDGAAVAAVAAQPPEPDAGPCGWTAR